MTETVAVGADKRSAAGVPKLHPGAVTEPVQIHSLLTAAQQAALPLTRGLNRKIEVESAVVEHVGADAFVLSTRNFEPDTRDIVFLNLSTQDQSYFFQARVLERLPDAKIRLEIPVVLYRQERRSRQRVEVEPAKRVVIAQAGNSMTREFLVADYSAEGIAIDVPDQFASRLDYLAELTVSGDDESQMYGVVRNKRPAPKQGWTRVGIELDATRPAQLGWTVIQDLSPPTGRERLAQTVRIAATGAQLAFERAIRRFGGQSDLPAPSVVDVYDSANRRIRALVDGWGSAADATAVVIPPAWGRTKETLMPLALTLVECFRRSGRAIRVVRFDGINKRGESYRDSDCLAPGREQYRFTFSQGARDIRAIVDHLHGDAGSKPRATVIVSFSASSIEARRAVCDDPRIDGWVCVVGTADLQSMMKSISGGIDYALGMERGIKFGLQEILGVAVDMDLAGMDAIEHSLAYLSDARREMASINVPITWIAGRHDAWMDKQRVRDAMSRGSTAGRKLIEIPTGHMLKSSRQALGVFQLIAREVAQMTGGPLARSVAPSIAQLDRTRLAEMKRLARPDVNLREFWGNYLLGKDRTVGFELMMLTSAYREFMLRQIEALNVEPGAKVVDVGSGTGGFPFYLGESSNGHVEIGVVELDFVKDGLKRARDRIGRQERIAFVEANFDGAGEAAIPIASRSVDAVIASLLLSYVRNPRAVIRELHRIVRPGGTVVVSSLRRDADMSKLFIEGAAELRERWSPALGGWVGETRFEEAVRGYMNEASRLLDLEEDGRFVFWDPDELGALLQEEGFEEVSLQESFGTPPQAGIASARRPVE